MTMGQQHRPIRRVALIGAGAVGSYFIWGLAKRKDVELTLIAEGDRLKRLAEGGININGETYRPVVKAPRDAGTADLIIIAVKYAAIEDAARMAALMTGEDTLILSVLNGLDSEEVVGRAAGMEHMLYSIMRIQSWREGDTVRFDPEATAGIFFGEGKKSDRTDRVRAVEELFKGSLVRYTFVPDMQGEIWSKFLANICRNIPQAMLGVGSGAYEDSSHVAWIQEALDREVHEVASAKGIVIPQAAPAVIATWRMVEKSARFSTLQDLDAHRHTEVDMFLGTLMRLAGEAGVPVPCSTMAYHFIKALEEKNDGLFDYEVDEAAI